MKNQGHVQGEPLGRNNPDGLREPWLPAKRAKSEGLCAEGEAQKPPAKGCQRTVRFLLAGAEDAASGAGTQPGSSSAGYSHID